MFEGKLKRDRAAYWVEINFVPLFSRCFAKACEFTIEFAEEKQSIGFQGFKDKQCARELRNKL